MERIRAERIARRSIPKENKLSKAKNSISHEENKKDDDNKKENSREDSPRDIHENIDEVDKLLKILKKNEPTSDNLFYRLSIIAYEIGDLHKAVVYAERFKNDPKIRASYLANGKLAMADSLTQLFLLCETLGWDFYKLRKLGAEHLEERHKDFEQNRWSDIK